MSKASPGSRLPRRHAGPQKHKTAPVATSGFKKAAVLVIITVLAGIPFVLGKYFELNFPDPYDSALNVYSAKRVLDGARIGIDEKPSAALGTLLMNVLGVWLFGYSETGPKLIQGIFQAAALVLMFVSMRKLFGLLAAAVGVIIASVYLSAPLIAKFGNVKEQYMIACMVIGVSCFVLRQLNGKWWWAVLAGAFVSWAPLFKETGSSVIGGIGLFVIAQPLFKHKTWKQTGIDILLLLAGAVAAIGPLYVWILGWNVHVGLPYSFVWSTLAKMLPAGGAAGQAKPASDYISAGRKLVPFSEQWPRVLRFYGLLILPVALAAGAIAARILRMIFSAAAPAKTNPKVYDRFVLLFGVWWLLDMAFVWISPASYEQYYLPLNASAAMLGGYGIALYRDKVSAAVYKGRWIVTGLVGLVLMTIMSWHIFFGVEKSAHTGAKYGQKKHGYAQRWDDISLRRRQKGKMSWENTGEYIRLHSQPTDKIYVWGWEPGIYLSAHRYSSSSKAVMMPRPTPQQLADSVAELLAEFKREPPKFIVDSRKLHIPTNRPPYELWPIAPKGLFAGMNRTWFLPPNDSVVARYDQWWSADLRKRFGDEEADRYIALAPFRKFVMDNYELVEPGQYVAWEGWPWLVHRMFDRYVLFRLKDSAMSKELR
ncbi:MAG TPA: glycosyltransferase family 39 protein [Sedimentisphaerales bacterium]|nr:glycosyltransferase family 39 protein [Sedimentisphaerales bacterium]